VTGPRLLLGILSALLAIQIATWTAARPSAAGKAVPMSAFWQAPDDLQSRDLFNGPWGAANAPDPKVSYRFLRLKKEGANPGVVVTDPAGRTWSVKQAAPEWDEGPVEVALSRVLSAVGYHQPPVYYLSSFMLNDSSGSRVEGGGRFRLEHESLKEQGDWSWRMNPFVGTQPYQGLLVILLMFASPDLKNSNNMLYDVTREGTTEQWYVVRDLGTALGEFGLMRPKRNDSQLFEQQEFITGFDDNGFVEFDHPIKQRMLVEGRITPNEVAWAGNLLAGLTERQWQDAFRAGGYNPEIAARFIRKIRLNIAAAQQISIDPPESQARLRLRWD
jgi:hypothetical protein